MNTPSLSMYETVQNIFIKFCVENEYFTKINIKEYQMGSLIGSLPTFAKYQFYELCPTEWLVKIDEQKRGIPNYNSDRLKIQEILGKRS